MKNSQRKVSFVIISLLLSLGGCAPLGPNFELPESKLPEQWDTTGTGIFKDKVEADNLGWWKEFNDPVLDKLIQTAYEQNLPLRTAGLRILEARASLGLVKGSLYPQSQNANGDILNIGTTGPADDRYFNSASIGFDAAWEMDFWGKFRRSIESADASLIADIANYDDILVTLTAEVARVYISIRTFEERIRLAKTNVNTQENALKLVQYQFDAGTVTELDRLQAKTLLVSTKATIPNLGNQLQKNRNALSTLLGVLPSDSLVMFGAVDQIPSVSAGIVVGFPADLLRRRPDIRQAEMQAAAQSALIGVALAELYPSFTLFGSLGWSATDRGENSLGDIFSSNAFSYSFGPAFKWNLFNYGRLKNQVRVQDARLEQLITIYQQTVLNAAREVEDSMAGIVNVKLEAEYVNQGVVSSKRSMELSLLQYEEGLADYQRVLDSTRSMTAKQDQYAQLQGQIATEFVGLYKSLGGGWKLRINDDFVSPEVKTKMKNRTDWGNLLDDISPGSD